MSNIHDIQQHCIIHHKYFKYRLLHITSKICSQTPDGTTIIPICAHIPIDNTHSTVYDTDQPHQHEPRSPASYTLHPTPYTLHSMHTYSRICRSVL